MQQELLYNEISHWAEVLLPLAVPNTFTYALQKEYEGIAKPGCRVEVVFGNRKKYAGLILSITNVNPGFPVKPVLSLLDEEPLLHLEQLKLWAWMSDYYMCTKGEVMAAALPANFKLSSESILLFNENYGEDFSNLDDDEYLIAEALLLRKQLKLGEVQQLLNEANVYPVIQRLIYKGIAGIYEELVEKYKVKEQNFIVLQPEYEIEENLEALLNDWKGAPKQMELLLSFLHLDKKEGEVQQPVLLKKAKATAAQLKGLIDKGILRTERRGIDRIKLLPKKAVIDFSLTADQASALALIQQKFKEQAVGLLHGVTGSGKTQIYISLIAEQLAAGKQSLYLLPEISLTAQITRRLEKHFGGNLAIYHSRFNQQERVELWNRVRTGEAKIIVGARSALFLPFKNLGLTIIDEEHDSSYKQFDTAPRYNARDTAIYNAALFTGSKVLLGTATPSLESYTNAKVGKYFYVPLLKRFSGIELPEIEIINTASIATPNNLKTIISPVLETAIEQTLKQGKQVILFQNRRGYDPYLICSTCGSIPKCTHCDVSLTLHKYSGKMHCHYCGSTYPKPVECTSCGAVNWLEKNFGTEKVEEVVDTLFPHSKVARMDQDSVKGKTAHNNLIIAFEEQRIDMLIGTQMVVKGLDFENVSLVGILDADGLLNFTNFRVHERAFQLMEQVSGRAGRVKEKGQVLIQCMNVTHPVLQFVKNHDYEAFYQFEMKGRKEFNYPPYSRLLILTLRHKDQLKLTDAANTLYMYLSKDLNGMLSGPAMPNVGRVRNEYIFEIMVKLPRNGEVAARLKHVVRNHINLLISEKRFRSIRVIPDVDPA